VEPSPSSPTQRSSRRSRSRSPKRSRGSATDPKRGSFLSRTTTRNVLQRMRSSKGMESSSPTPTPSSVSRSPPVPEDDALSDAGPGSNPRSPSELSGGTSFSGKSLELSPVPRGRSQTGSMVDKDLSDSGKQSLFRAGGGGGSGDSDSNLRRVVSMARPGTGGDSRSYIRTNSPTSRSRSPRRARKQHEGSAAMLSATSLRSSDTGIPSTLHGDVPHTPSSPLSNSARTPTSPPSGKLKRKSSFKFPRRNSIKKGY